MNVWRLLRSEIHTNSYSFENMAYHILHKRFSFFRGHLNLIPKRVPKYSPKVLTEWYMGGMRWRVLLYFLERTQMTIEFLGQLDIISRTR